MATNPNVQESMQDPGVQNFYEPPPSLRYIINYSIKKENAVWLKRLSQKTLFYLSQHKYFQKHWK